MHQFHLNCTEESSIIRYRSISKMGVVRSILTELWPFFLHRFWLNCQFLIFGSITWEGMQQFLSNFTEGLSIIKCKLMSNSPIAEGQNNPILLYYQMQRHISFFIYFSRECLRSLDMVIFSRVFRDPKMRCSVDCPLLPLLIP